MANYIGMNYNLDGVAFDCLDGTTIMAFKGDVVQFFTNEVLTSTASRIAMFPEAGTNQINYVYRSGTSTIAGQFYQIWLWNTAGDYWRYEVSTPHQNPTTYTHLQTGTHSWKVNRGPAGANDDLMFKNDNGVMKVDQLGNTGNFQPYGAGNVLYPTLPNTQIPDACWNNTLDGFVYVSIVDTIYKLDAVSATMVSFAKYNVPPGPVIPPTPLPDHLITYSAPSQFNLFSNNVALVTETPLGWNFTKTILNADKMELYLYHSGAPGAMPFNYNELLDIKISMMNNLVLPVGEIFFTIWTGPPTAPNWYNYKDIFNMTPPLGTTLDTALVETILALSDIRTDPILAIAVHSNSSQQQVNCDVHKVSFNILLPATNESQRVVVELQNNFIVVDDKYWDLEQTAQGYTTNILGGWSQSTFSPNIIAGNYPQSGTFQDQTAGTAWTLGQVTNEFQRWTTADSVTWAPATGEIAMFINNPASTNPGIDINGIAYIGCGGIFNVNPAWVTDQPTAWEIIDTNLLKISYQTRPAEFMSPLGLMFGSFFTPLQKQTGIYTTNLAGIAVTAWIGIDVPNTPNLVFPREGTFRCLSETQIMLRLGWQHNETTYTLNQSDPTEVVGQYIDPNFTTSYAPTSYKMPTDWVKIPVIPVEEFILTFSSGLSDIIDTDGTYSVSVTPSSTSGVTYSYTANYYTSADVLISPVIGFGATGIISSFNIVFATNVPATAEYISFVCTSSENVVAQLSLTIIQPPSVPFILTFSGGLNNQISADGTYSVAPVPVNALQSYTYTAVFRDIAGTSLGAVSGAGASGVQSSFTITYASLPASVAYIDYNCTDGTESSQLSLTIVPVCPVCPACDSCCPAIPGNDDVELIRSTAGNIEYTQHNPIESLKLLTGDRLGELKMTLVDSYGDTLHTDKPIYYECEVRSTNSGGGSITES